jgi:hypothetical protein
MGEPAEPIKPKDVFSVKDALARQEAKRELERINDLKRYAARFRAEARARKNCPITKAQDAVFQPILNALKSFNQELSVVREEMRVERLKGMLADAQMELDACRFLSAHEEKDA